MHHREHVARLPSKSSHAEHRAPMVQHPAPLNSTPVILLAFANAHGEPGRYLRHLPDELRQVRAALAAAEDKNLCQVEVVPDATLDDILRFFRQHQDRVAIFHYAGHADSYRLLLQDTDGRPAEIGGAGFAAFLREQRGLQLVFLNACSTWQQVAGLLDAGVSAVIATAQDINDQVATRFAIQFYTALSSGVSLEQAYNEAAAAVVAEHDGELRHVRPVGEHAPPSGQLPWELHVRPGAEQAKWWDLPTAANDPLFGLPPLPEMDLPEQPFLHLARFREKDAPIFFGRGHQIRELYTRVADPKSEPIILFYGQSGVGKSSLLAAGLLPRLESEQRVLYLRRDLQAGLLGTVRAGLERAFPEWAQLGDNNGRQFPNTLPGIWLDAERQIAQPLTVVLDQVEEFYTRAQADPQEEMNALLDALAATFVDRSRRPRGKLILSFRKEWLADLDKQLATRELPRSEVFLERLDRAGAMEAINGVALTHRLQMRYRLRVEENLPELIADDLLADDGSAVAPTLQILLAQMWERAKIQRHDSPLFDSALYNELRGKTLDDFLGEQIDALAADYKEQVESGLVSDLLYFHTTRESTAEQRTHAEIRAVYSHQPEVAMQLVDRCRDLYLLVDPAPNQPGAEPSSRLAHDTLAPLVRARFDESDRAGQRARRILENRITTSEEAVPAALDSQDLMLVENGRNGMRAWTEPERRLVQNSRAARRQRTLFGVGALLLFFVTVVGFSTWVLFEQRNAFLANQDTLRNESNLLASRALNQLDSDPVASLHLSLQALPAPGRERPYVPRAEFALTQALHASLERGHLSLADLPLTRERIAGHDAHPFIAAATDQGLHFIPRDLPAQLSPAITDAPLQGVAWRGDTLLLGYGAQTVAVWSHEGTLLNNVVLPDATITCAAWHPDRPQIAICAVKAGAASSILLWSYETNTLQSIDGVRSPKPIDELHWSPDGTRLAATLAGAPAHIWAIDDVTASVPITVGTEVADLAFVDADRFVTWSSEDELQTQLWQIDGAPLVNYAVENLQSTGFALSPDHAHLLLFLSTGDMQLFDMETGETGGGMLRGHDRRVLAAAWHPNGTYLATSAADGTARVWNLNSGANVVTLRGHYGTASLDRIDVHGVLWDGDTHLITHGEDGTLRRWHVLFDDGAPVCAEENDADEYPVCFHASRMARLSSGEILSAQWVDAQTVAVVQADLQDNIAKHISLIDGRTLISVTNEPDLYPQMVWDPSGQYVFSYVEEDLVVADATESREVDGIVRSAQTGKEIARIAGPIAVAHWLDAGILISRKSGTTLLIEPFTNKRIVEATNHTERISATALHTPTQRLATADGTGLVQVWDLQTRELLFAHGRDLPVGEQRPITELVWSPDGERLIAGGRTITLWDIAQQQEIWSTGELGDESPQVAFSPSGAFVAAAVDTEIYVWAAAAPGGILWKQEQGNASQIHDIQWIAGVHWDHQIEPTLVHRLLMWFDSGLRPPTGTRPLLLTRNGDNSVRLWDWQAGVEVARFVDAGLVNVAVPDGDAPRLLVAGRIGGVRVWELWHSRPDELVAAAEASLAHDLTAEQIQDFALPTPTPGAAAEVPSD